MRQTILHFPDQFSFEPKIENKDRLSRMGYCVVLGMGGSHLAADLLKTLNPNLNILVHSDYGLPAGIGRDTFVIATSYSGNTEEVLSGVRLAQESGLPLAAISIGGDLLKSAQEKKYPYVQLPDTHIQPRMALGFMIRALAALMGLDDVLKDTRELSQNLSSAFFEREGKELAYKLTGRIPIIYTSTQNTSIAYNWKIKFNETGKIPAFYNVIPELNHNEMTGFDINDATRALCERCSFILIKDTNDHPRVQKRMTILESLLGSRHFPVHAVLMTGQTRGERIFSSLLRADWTAFHTALNYGNEPEHVPMVEEFKRFMAT